MAKNRWKNSMLATLTNVLWIAARFFWRHDRDSSMPESADLTSRTTKTWGILNARELLRALLSQIA
jgi:hypothetical protein